jgi:hypothetical protein
VSVLARQLAPRQGSIQSDPVSIGAKGSQLLTAQGRLLADVKPRSIRRALGRPDGPLADLQALRDRDIDRIYRLYKDQGTPKDLELLDAWARSRDQVRSLSDALLQRLDQINSDKPDDQILAASVLAAMNITPVMTVRGEFGADNHNDEGLARETEETVSGVARMGRLMELLRDLRTEGALRHDVIVGTYNVFGRDLRKKGLAGRDHNRGHHVAVLMGPGLRGGVVGGLEMTEIDMRCTSIDSATGAAGGDIPFEATLGSLAKTMGRALQVPERVLDEEIALGKPVLSALA